MLESECFYRVKITGQMLGNADSGVPNTNSLTSSYKAKLTINVHPKQSARIENADNISSPGSLEIWDIFSGSQKCRAHIPIQFKLVSKQLYKMSLC